MGERSDLEEITTRMVEYQNALAEAQALLSAAVSKQSLVVAYDANDPQTKDMQRGTGSEGL